MQTQFPSEISATPEGKEAESILRTCVHCGFCNATCPTYQLLGNELDGPRGRIYLIKEMLEGRDVTTVTQNHLDRCLTCRACETTCPSGVKYGRLVDIGRQWLEQHLPRAALPRLLRWGLRRLLLNSALFDTLYRAARSVRAYLPKGVRTKVLTRQVDLTALSKPQAHHPRRALLLEGCVQPTMAPEINHAARHVLERLGITVEATQAKGCCGALSYHLAAQDEALALMRRNIDAWSLALAAGADMIISTASGCGVMVKEYGHLFRNDPHYAERAATISAAARDIAEVVVELFGTADIKPTTMRKVAVHTPCTLQHGQKLQGGIEQILKRSNADCVSVADQHLCCGSAGTYSILQPKLATQLRDNKISALLAERPDIILTGNIGCLAHLQSGTDVPVWHWVEWLAREMGNNPSINH